MLPSWGDGVLTSWEIGSVGNTSGEISLNFLKFGVIWGVVMFGQVGLKARSSTQGSVLQYAVFIIKLVLKYLPQYLNGTHPSIPSSTDKRGNE